jgi:peptidoglycan/LPS O-acetylase OafA/YrhL
MDQPLADSSVALGIFKADSQAPSGLKQQNAGGAAHRFAMLDGWRALSITLVLAAHLLPLGPKSLQLNEAVAAMGMALFFTLSGFLITRFLTVEHASVRSFVIRRFFRIVPLSWLVCLIVLPLNRATFSTYLAHLFFYANLPPFWLIPMTSHLWSLCVEMQFYVGIALIVATFGRRGLYFIPLLCLGVTGLRIFTGAHISIVTWLRIDEILAGGIVALAYSGWFGSWPMRLVRHINVYAMLPLLLLASHRMGGALEYLRPYLAATMVAASLVNAPPLLARIFEHRLTGWIATISYALYIIHGVLMNSWLGSGHVVEKYLKRPVLICLTFLLAHLSTYRFEQPCIAYAKRLTNPKAKCGSQGNS